MITPGYTERNTTSVDISTAREVGGWMDEDELIWLASQAQIHDVIVELGSYLGRSTRALVDNARGEVYAVDDWLGPRDQMINLTDINRELLFDIFQWNMRDVPEGKLEVIQIDHAHIPWIMDPDMIFIDGSHEYDDVIRDITNCNLHLRSGGLLSGHDYGDIHPGVAKAVNYLLPEAQVVPGTTIWYYRKE
jgi:hypothetical protein